MSDNELDAELLALAGGDESSSEEEDNVLPSSQERGKNDTSRTIERSPPRRGVAQKLKSRGRARRAQRDSDEEDSFGDSDVESSPRKARSPSDAGLDDDAPLYPIEGKFRSEADRADIMAMTEIEREEILAERAAEIQRRTQDQQLRRLLQQNRRDDDFDGKKRKAGAADLDDGQRKSSRQKTKATDKIEAYKRQRELKGAQRAKGEERRRDQRSPSAGGDYSDRDASGESEVEWDDGRRASPPPRKDEPPPEVEDFDRVRVGRSNFSKFLYDPPFENAVRGCYCRVNCGQDGTGPKYRIGLVKGFHDGRPYTMDGHNGKKVFTDQYVVIANGKKEREYPFAACSDGKFTSSEFAEFKNTLSEDGIRFPTRRQIDGKLAELKSMVNHQWTEADIQAKMDKKWHKQKAYTDYHRERITRRRDDAARRGDDATVARCNKDLADLDASGVVSTSKTASPIKKEDQQTRLAQLNKANRKTNSEEIRKALIAESVAKQKARLAAIAKLKEEEERKKAAADAAAQNGLKVPGSVDDLFGDGSDISRAGTPRNGTSRAGTPMNGVKEKKAFGQFSRKKMDDEVIAAMDLGIDIDI
ncbi:plus-3-domain-containing protein [Myriangium duriaei CBS 260.36]|uniref:Plus-3-domain-containing protein n=1 Tax=Myriangium duriaei CBS 260.36 TaxID=1168546 RepID=A0A9P4J459_9PEZI|nr:plus-3-domain-containing protein [Myriangium duriaei CBS 260.36]